MPDTVTVPGAGPVSKKWAIAGVAVLGGILAVAYYRHARNASATAAAATDATAPDPNAVDPNTGLTYGEEAAGVASGTLAGAATPFGDTSGIVGYDAQGNPIYTDQVGYGPAPSFVNNGAWAQAAEQYLVSTTGADAGVVAAALGAYIEGQPLTEAQASVVRQAQAFFGQPPQAGSNGFPPSLRMVAPPTGGTGGGTGGTGSVLAAPGLSVTPGKGFADFGWSQVAGATVGELLVTGAGGKGTGTSHYDHVVSGNHAGHVALAPGKYNARVRAGKSASDVHGHWSATKTFTVTKG